MVEITANDIKVITPAGKDMQICSFLWVYYGFPTSSYEGTNVEDMRFKSGFEMGKNDENEVDCAQPAYLIPESAWLSDMPPAKGCPIVAAYQNTPLPGHAVSLRQSNLAAIS